MKRTLLLTALTCLSLAAFAQWTQRASLTNGARHNAVGFSILGKGYIATGHDGTSNLNDCWEFDPVLNTWTQRASMPDAGRQGAASFVIGTKAYVLAGQRDTAFLRDLVEYDQVSNTWTVRAQFIGTARSEGSAFAIGTKGYFGLGYDGAYKSDFFEWDQTTNTWTQKAQFPPNQRSQAMGFALNNGRGYVGGGYASGNIYQDIFEYNPGTNQWLYVGMNTYYAYAVACCAIANTAFYGTGIDDNATYFNNFAQWDPVNGGGNLTVFSGTPRYNAVSFAIGNSVFLGTGFDSWVTDDLWEYTTTIGRNEVKNSFEASVFPTLAENSVYLNVFGLNSFNITLLNSSLEVMGKSQITNPKSEISTASLAPGVYFIRIESESGSRLLRFVKF